MKSKTTTSLVHNFKKKKNNLFKQRNSQAVSDRMLGSICYTVF